MSRRLHQVRVLLLSAFFALGSARVVAAGGPPTWAGGGGSGGNSGGGGNGGGNGGGGGNNNASNPQNWLDGAFPGKSDRARVNAGHVTINLPLVFGALDFLGGTIEGSGANTLTLTDPTVGASIWSGGDFSNGAIVDFANGLEIKTGTAKSLIGGSKLKLTGNTRWTGDAITTGDGAEFLNTAAFTTDFDGTIVHGSGARATFKNDGSFTKTSAAGGATRIEARFENNGVVRVESGKLHLAGGGRNSANASIFVEAAAALEISGDLELLANSSLFGPGVGRLLAGTLAAHGAVDIRHFSFEGGALAGSQTFHGFVDWHAGNWNSLHAGAVTTLGRGAELNLRSHAGHDFNNRSIHNYGTVNWHAGHIRGGGGSEFVNHHVFNDLNGGPKSFLAPGTFGGTASFTNHGEYRKTDGGTTTMSVPFTNHGTIKISSGALVFASTFTNHGALNVTNGASAQFSTPLTFGPTATLSGVGTIDAPLVTAAGPVAPGVSPGALAITGGLTLLETSTLLIELGGGTPGSGYDQLNVGGVAQLGGKLDVRFVNGYEHSITSTATFTILTAQDIAGLTGVTGVFANVAPGQRLFTSDGWGSFQVNYGAASVFGANSVVLSHFAAVPEPSTWAMIGLGAGVVFISLRRRRT